MRCKTVRRLLSDYAEGVLDVEKSEKVRSHLEACDGCMQKLEEHRAYMEKVALLRDVRAPEGFLEGVKARIRSEANGDAVKERKRLFFPGYKLPLELAGALAVVLIAVVIFRNIEPERKRPAVAGRKTEQTIQPPGMKEEPAEASRQEIAPETETADGESTLAKKRTEQRRDPAQPVPEEEATLEHEPDLESVMKATEPPGGNDIEALGTTPEAAVSADRLLASSPDEKALAVELTIAVRKPPEELREKTVDKKEARAMEAETAAAVEKESQLLTRDEPFDTVEGEIRSLAEELGGMAISIDHDTGKDRRRRISVQLPAGRYEDLIEGLSLLGMLEEPVPEGPADEKPSLIVEITITE